MPLTPRGPVTYTITRLDENGVPVPGSEGTIQIPEGPRGRGVSPVDAEDGTGRAEGSWAEALDRMALSMAETRAALQTFQAQVSGNAPAPRAEYDELIESTWAEFPPDPYYYGRIYPEGPSRWTPPEDPDEKVRSCPA